MSDNPEKAPGVRQRVETAVKAKHRAAGMHRSADELGRIDPLGARFMRDDAAALEAKAEADLSRWSYTTSLPEEGNCGELVPLPEPAPGNLAEHVRQPADVLAHSASAQRMELAGENEALALDAGNSIKARDSIERMLIGQAASAHKLAMRLMAKAEGQLAQAGAGSAYYQAHKALNIPQIGRELNARYVVEGSIRKSGTRVRVTVQLIDASTGSHVWAERYDRDIGDIFDVQDDITRTIVSTLAVHLEDEALAMAKRKPPESMQAYDYWLRGNRLLGVFTQEANQQAREFFEKAIEIEPNYARAYAGLAATYEWSAWYSAWNQETLGPRELAFEHAQKAVALDDTDPHPHISLAWNYTIRHEFNLARRHLDRALALNPNDADCLANRGMLLNDQGEPEEGKKCLELAIRLNPHHPNWYLAYLGASHFLLGDYDRTTSLLEQAPDGLPEVRAILMSAHAYAGRLAEAKKHANEFLRTYCRHWTGKPSARGIAGQFSFKRLEDTERLFAGMVKAGLPE